MRRILRLLRREYLASVKTKGFIIMLVLMPVIMSGSAIAMILLRGKVDTTDKHIAVLDRSGIVIEMLLTAAEERNNTEVHDKETGKKVKPAYILDIIESGNTDPQEHRLQLSDRIRRGELHAFLEVGANVRDLKGEENACRIKYHAKNAAVDSIRDWLNGTINPYLRKVRMSDAGVDESRADEIMTWIRVEPMGLASVDKETGRIQDARQTSEEEAIFVPIILFFLMFTLVMMGAMPLLQSTMEEKTQRIAEVLLGSMKPHEFMAGKVLGGLAITMTGASLYVIGGVFFLGKIGLKGFIPFDMIPWFFTFLVIEIVMVGSMLTAFGAACNDPKDAQNLTFPAMFPVFFPMFIFMPVMMEPTARFATWLSFVPPFTPMLMLIRKASPVGIPAWQPWVGLIGVVLFTMFSIWAGGRIFRVGILMQGGPPKLSSMIKWTLRG